MNSLKSFLYSIKFLIKINNLKYSQYIHHHYIFNNKDYLKNNFFLRQSKYQCMTRIKLILNIFHFHIYNEEDTNYINQLFHCKFNNFKLEYNKYHFKEHTQWYITNILIFQIFHNLKKHIDHFLTHIEKGIPDNNYHFFIHILVNMNYFLIHIQYDNQYMFKLRYQIINNYLVRIGCHIDSYLYHIFNTHLKLNKSNNFKLEYDNHYYSVHIGDHRKYKDFPECFDNDINFNK